jgi:hypothetical protein
MELELYFWNRRKENEGFEIALPMLGGRLEKILSFSLVPPV